MRGKVAQVTDVPTEDDEPSPLYVVAEDTMLDKIVRLPADMVVHMNALVPREDATDVAQIMKCSRSSDGFLLEKHPKLGPVETALDGVYIAGAVQGPKDIPDTVAQGSAAASMALGLLARGSVSVEAATALHDEERCSGCRVCTGVCPYGAVTYDADEGVAALNETLCKGCGTCVAACPSEAMTARHFTGHQILSQLQGILGA